MADQKVEVRLTANASGLQAGMGAAATSVEASARRIRESWARVGSAFSSVGLLVAGTLTTIAAGFAASVKHQIDFADNMSKGAQRAGVSTEAMSELAYVAKLADIEVGELAKTFAKLAVTLSDAKAGQKEAVELLKRLKIDPKGLKDGDDLLLALADRFSQMADGAGKTATAVEVFGERIGPKLIPLLNGGRIGIAELREEARRLGVVIDTETGKAAEEFNDNLTRIQAASTKTANAMAKELLPGLIEASSFFVKATKEAGLFQAVLISIGALMAKALGIDEAGKLESRMKDLQAEGERLKNVMVGVDNVLAVEPGNEMAQRRLGLLKKQLAEVSTEALKVSAELARVRSGAPDAGAGRGSVNPDRVVGKPFVPGAKTVEAPKEASRMPEFEAMLEAERAAATERDALHSMAKSQELAFWQNILATQQRSAADSLAIGRKLTQARIAVLQEDAKTARDLGAVGLEAWRERKLAEVEIDQDAALTRRALGQISNAQLLQQEQTFEERKMEIRRTALAASQATLDPARDPVQRAQIDLQLEAAEAAHQQRMAQIRGQIAVESAMEMNAIWGEAAARTSSLWDQATQAMMQGTLTWRGAMNAVGQELVGMFSGVVKRMVVQWLFGEQSKTAATAMGTAQRWAMEAMASAKSIALWAMTAVKNIMTNAWAAMAAAWQAMVGIPYVGPVLAVAAAGAAFAGVSALAGKVSSAEGGYDIPAGVNPMTQLHEREMVLPAKQADVIRTMADGGAGAGGGTIVINTGGGDFVHKNELAKLLKQMNRDFVFVGYR